MKFDLSLTMEEVAALTGTPLSSLYRWKAEDPKLFAVIWRGCMELKLDQLRTSLPS